MSEIPKRPPWKDLFVFPQEATELYKLQCAMTDHQEAVAKVLWKALNDTVECDCEDCPVCDAINSVKASGWTPRASNPLMSGSFQGTRHET